MRQSCRANTAWEAMERGLDRTDSVQGTVTLSQGARAGFTKGEQTEFDGSEAEDRETTNVWGTHLPLSGVRPESSKAPVSYPMCTAVSHSQIWKAGRQVLLYWSRLLLILPTQLKARLINKSSHPRRYVLKNIWRMKECLPSPQIAKLSLANKGPGIQRRKITY